MELGDVRQYFAGKNILVTGVTGFLGKGIILYTSIWHHLNLRR